MRGCVGGSSCARDHYPGRGLLLGGAPPDPAPSFSLDDARLERAIGATTTVLFVASVAYIVLSTIYGCLCTSGSRQQQEPDASDGVPGPQQPAAAFEQTKRALEEIPVVVLVVPDTGCGGPDRAGGGAGAEHGGEPAAAAAAGECAVCLAEYAAGEEVRVLPACRHGFHRECVDRWLLTRAPTCPVCRALVAAHAEGPGGKGATGDAALPSLGP